MLRSWSYIRRILTTANSASREPKAHLASPGPPRFSSVRGALLLQDSTREHVHGTVSIKAKGLGEPTCTAHNMWPRAAHATHAHKDMHRAWERHLWSESDEASMPCSSKKPTAVPPGNSPAHAIPNECDCPFACTAQLRCPFFNFDHQVTCAELVLNCPEIHT